MSSATRPKPRPRPRARVAPATTPVAANVPPSSSPGPSSLVEPLQQATSPTAEDEDAMFMRNQGRTAQMWSHLSKMTAEKENKKRKSGSDTSDSDREAGSSPRHRAHKRKSQRRRNDALPDWTRKRLNEIVISSDSDDDLTMSGKEETSMTDDASQDKPKRARSRSITPPPPLTQFAIQRARAAVQQLVGSNLRAPSPTYEADESIDTIVLDPELASIAQRVHTEVQMHDGPSVRDVGGPEVVNIRVAWKPHPLNPSGQSHVWGFRQKRHDNFYVLFGEVADSASVLADSLVITYEGKRVFSSSNPHSIGIWAEAEFEACDKVTYEYLQENKRIRSPSVVPHVAESKSRSPSRGRSQSVTILSDLESTGGQDQEEPEESNTFHLTIRSERTKVKTITLLVRPTTKCGAIVRAFLKRAGLEAEYPITAPTKGRGRAAPKKLPALSVDGDRMDAETEIGETDLEDGDQVDVIGL